MDTQKKDKIIFIGSIVVGIISLIVIITVLTLYTTKKAQKVKDDRFSKKRIQVVNELLNQYFGANWIYVLLSFVLFLLAILVMLYMVSRKLTFNVSDRASYVLSILGYILVVTFIIFVVVLFYTIKREQKVFSRTSNTRYLINYQNAEKETKKTQKIIGISMAILGVLVLGVSLVLDRKHYLKKK